MKKVASMDVELTVEERNLLSVAYKNVIGARRASWRIISSLEQKEENKGGEDKLNMIRDYRKAVSLVVNSFKLVLRDSLKWFRSQWRLKWKQSTELQNQTDLQRFPVGLTIPLKDLQRCFCPARWFTAHHDQRF